MPSGEAVSHGRWPISAGIRRVSLADILAGMLASFGISVLIWHLSGARTAFQIGGDEGYELLKAKMVEGGYLLYVEIWNDQPPLFTNILSLAFSCFGVDVGVARLVSTAFSAVLLFTFYCTCLLTVGRVAAWGGLAALMAVPEFLTLYVSVMLEVPTFTFGFLSLLSCLADERFRCPGKTFYRDVASGSRWTLIVSGLLFGCALQTKFTALLVFPAIITGMIMTGHGVRIAGHPEIAEPGLDCNKLLQSVCHWSAGLITGFVVLMIANPEEAFGSLFRAHFSDAVSRISGADPWLNLSMSVLFKEYPGIVFALMGCVAGLYKRDRNVCVPVAMLVFALLIHLWHTPFWTYYYLHIGLPAAWLTGYFLSEACGWLLRAGPFRADPRYAGRLLVSGFAIFGCISLLLFSVRKSAAISWVGSIPVDRGLMRSLVGDSQRGGWVYCKRPIYVFYSDLNSPPELAIVPLKRLWSGELTEAEICRKLNYYKVDHIVMFSEQEEKSLAAVLRSDYVLEYRGIGVHYRSARHNRK